MKSKNVYDDNCIEIKNHYIKKREIMKEKNTEKKYTIKKPNCLNQK